MALTGQFEKRLGIGQESTWGSVGAVRRWIPFDSEAFGLPEYPANPVQEIWSNRALSRTFKGAKLPAPEFSMVVDPTNFGDILKAAMGTSSVAQFGTFLAYLHTFTIQNVAELPSLFGRVLEYGSFVYDYTGLRVNEFTLEAPDNDVIKASVKMLGKDRITGTAMGGTFGTWQPYTQHANAQFLLDGAAAVDVKNWKLTFKNGLTQHVTSGTNNGPSFISSGRFDLMGEFVLLLQNETEVNKFLNGTATSLDILIQGGTFTTGTMKNTLRLTMPHIDYSAIPIKTENGVVSAGVSFIASFGTTALGTGQLIGQVINSVASYD